jgi:hypothetical protein
MGLFTTKETFIKNKEVNSERKKSNKKSSMRDVFIFGVLLLVHGIHAAFVAFSENTSCELNSDMDVFKEACGFVIWFEEAVSFW